jgi:hypothetical protein
MIFAPGPVPIGREAGRQAAKHELSKRIYHRYDDSWPIAILKWLSHELAKLFDTASRHAPGGGAGAIAFIGILVALVLLARWRLGPLGRQARAVEPVLGDQVRTAAEHRAAAATAAASGDWNLAVVEGMRAVARQLEETGLLDARPGRTADELARDAARRLPSAAGSLASAATTFDAVAYGGRPATSDSYDVVRRADDAVRHPKRLAGVT